MVDYNPLSPKLYRKLLSTIYQQTQKDAKLIKENFSNNRNPICQKEPRCLSVKYRNYNLTQMYNKKMEEKPEKLHKRRIPLKKNIAINLSVLAPENNNSSIKIYDNIRKNQCSMSAPKIDRHRKFISLKGNYRNFYLDSFNSIKQNQNDINNKKNIKFRNRPKEHDYINGTVEYRINHGDNHKNKKPFPNTKDDIFPDNKKPNIQIKVNRNERLTRKKMYSKAYGDTIGSLISTKDNNKNRIKNSSKPCNNNFKLVTNEARKNAGVRYYFEKNASQIELI